jgi:GR25 family glycosyltransferase involved in LPS biosynthesis
MKLDLNDMLKNVDRCQIFDLEKQDVQLPSGGTVVYGKWEANRVKKALEKGNKVIQILERNDEEIKPDQVARNYPDMELLKSDSVTVICDDLYREVYQGLLKDKSPENLMMAPSRESINGFVILLMRDLSRVGHVHQKLTTVLTGLRIFPAIDALTPHAIDNCVRQFKLPIMKPIRAGRIGCFFSHYSLWSDLLGSKSRPGMLILEDDNVPVEGFMPKFEKVLEELPPTFDLLHLYILPNEKEMVNKKSGKDGKDEGLIVKGIASKQTCAYLISRKGAHKLCSVVNSIKESLDDLMKKQVESGYLECYAVKEKLFDNLGVEGVKTKEKKLKSNTQESKIYVPDDE